MSFQGKVAIVAGGGGGIGQAVARAFGAEGAQVVPWDISETGLKETESSIRDKRGKVMAMKVNVLKYDDVAAATKQVLGHFGKVDILVVTVGGKFGAFNSRTSPLSTGTSRLSTISRPSSTAVTTWSGQ